MNALKKEHEELLVFIVIHKEEKYI